MRAAPTTSGSTAAGSSSAVDLAADTLRQMALDGSLEPGAPLREAVFSDRLGIARHTFRAATQILIGEGLLRRAPNRGVHLAVLDEGDIADVYRLRKALELEAVRQVVAGGARIRGAERAVERMVALPESAPWRRFVDADMAFHRAVIDAAESERISRAFTGVQSEILLCMAHLRPHYERFSEITIEHEELLSALLDGDVAIAEVKFRDHLDDAADRLVQALRAQDRAPA